MHFDDIVEVGECHWRDANAYMAAGYQLLAIQGANGARKNPDGRGWYVKRSIRYVMGRTRDVPHFEVKETEA